MRLTGAFPEQLTIASGATTAIPVEQGVELSIDVTMEYYQILAGLLTSPTGLTGVVSMTLASHPGPTSTGPTDPGSPPTAPLVKQFPVRLALGKPGPMPVEVRIPPDTVSPKEVTLVNTSQIAVRIGGAFRGCLRWTRTWSRRCRSTRG